MIYVIEAIGLGIVKFGHAKNPEKRLSVLKTGSPVPLKLLAKVNWHDSNEFLIHRFLSASRVNGEWFKATSEVVDLVQIMMCQNATEQRRFEVAMEMLASRV